MFGVDHVCAIGSSVCDFKIVFHDVQSLSMTIYLQLRNPHIEKLLLLIFR
jgi:hypothetical protein